MPSPQADGVHMSVGVNEARRNDLVGAIDDFGAIWHGDVGANVDNLVALDKNIGMDGFRMVIGLVDDDSSILEQGVF